MAEQLALGFRASWSGLTWRRLAVAVLCAWMALAPSLAEARAGSGTSQGSRGSRSYSGNEAQPLQRSVTPPPAPRAPQYAPSPSYASPYGGGFMQRHPFMSGLFGGLIGAGLAGMLFGHDAWAADASPTGSMFGMLLQFIIIGGLIWLAVAFFRRRAGYALAGGTTGYPRTVGASALPAPVNPVEITISDADFTAWTGLLTGIQEAWSRSDLAGLRRYVTPEMLSYFAEELARNASQGVENRVERVNLLKGDLQEAWQEGDLDYASARLSWSALDYSVRPAAAPGEHEVIVAGDPAHAVEATEVWTFVRSRGGSWLLSAIQQA